MEGFYSIYLLKWESFCELTENPTFESGLSSMICDITNMLKANPRQIFNLKKCDVETLCLQCTNTKNGLHDEVRNICGPKVQFMSPLSAGEKQWATQVTLLVSDHYSCHFHTKCPHGVNYKCISPRCSLPKASRSYNVQMSVCPK